ncbi:MAG: hypothetical protein ACO1N5_13650 [Noviherbaspirillum sp.]
MRENQELVFIAKHFRRMCRADQLTIMALIDSRARANQKVASKAEPKPAVCEEVEGAGNG